MFTLTHLAIPIIAAPMAGGPSTPDLVVHVSQAGGLGFLAAGYKTPDATARQIQEVQHRTKRPFGVNLFVPQSQRFDENAIAAYRARLQSTASKYGVELPKAPRIDNDWYDDKINLVISLGVPVVSFTFGLPSPSVVAQLQTAGTYAVATVTTVAEAEAAASLGVDGLCVQGPDAGGHRATFHVDDEPEPIPLVDLVKAVSLRTDTPIIAAGGIHTGDQVADLLERGAAAVQLGTAFLRSPESGAKPAHKDALVSQQFTRTVVTRVFSGRTARPLLNDFIADHEGHAPAAYPQVHHLTSGLRAAAGKEGNPKASPSGQVLGTGRPQTNRQQGYCARYGPRREPCTPLTRRLAAVKHWLRLTGSARSRSAAALPYRDACGDRWSGALIPACRSVSGMSLLALIASQDRVQGFNGD